VFDFVTSELTLKRGDFGAVSAGADVALRLLPRFDLVLSYDGSGMEKKSEFREWEDTDGRPIEQSTTFSRQGWSLNVRYDVLPDGRSLGRFAWVPARYTPWVSAGIGRTNYTFSQNGDFIDFDRGNNVFRDSYKSSQWTSTWQMAGGVDFSLSQRFALTTQARYLFGKADLQYDYSGFDPIDLSGIGLSAGLSVRF
jgi:opacity protein-like surface antigen